MVTVTIKVVEPAENHDEVRPQIVTIKVDRYDQAAPTITIKAQLSRSQWLIKQVGTGSHCIARIFRSFHNFVCVVRIPQ